MWSDRGCCCEYWELQRRHYVTEWTGVYGKLQHRAAVTELSEIRSVYVMLCLKVSQYSSMHSGTFVTVWLHTAVPQCVGRADNTGCTLCSVSGHSYCIVSAGTYCDSSHVLGHHKVWVRHSART